MPSVKVTANKMVDADATFISLVERGANRIPFKIIKQENNMAGSKGFGGLDLGSIFTRKSEDKDARIVGIATMGGDGLESVTKQLEEAGFIVSDMLDMGDGSVVFKQSDEAIDSDTQVVKVSDNVAIITKGFRPYSMDMTDYGAEGVSFADAVAAQGFYPGLRTIIEVMQNMVNSSLDSAMSPTDAAKVVSKLFDEAKTYTMSFVNALPQKAFKLDSIEPVLKSGEAEVDPAIQAALDADALIAAEAAAAAAAAEVATGEDGTDTSGDTSIEGAGEALSDSGELTAEVEEVAKAAMDSEEKAYLATLSGKSKFAFIKASQEERKTMMGSVKKTDSDNAVLTSDQISSIFAKQMEVLTNALIAKMDLTIVSSTEAVVAKVDAKMSTLVEGLSSLTTRVTEAEAVAKVATEAVAGTVVTGSESGDAIKPVVTKTEVVQGSFGGREIDTAFMGNPRKRNSR